MSEPSIWPIARSRGQFAQNALAIASRVTKTLGTRTAKEEGGKCANPMEVSMNTRVRLLVQALVLVLGLVLIVGGIITTKYGAVVVGIIVAGVSVQQFLKTNSATNDERSGHAP